MFVVLYLKLMLSKTNRLSASEVREILTSGRLVRCGDLSAKFKSNTGVSKAAVIVSAKVAKNAVERNKLRREVYRVLRTSLPKNIRAVFFIHKPIIDQDELNSLCLKLF